MLINHGIDVCCLYNYSCYFEFIFYKIKNACMHGLLFSFCTISCNMVSFLIIYWFFWNYSLRNMGQKNTYICNEVARLCDSRLNFYIYFYSFLLHWYAPLDNQVSLPFVFHKFDGLPAILGLWRHILCWPEPLI